jgi:hypothetical protein
MPIAKPQAAAVDTQSSWMQLLTLPNCQRTTGVATDPRTVSGPLIFPLRKAVSGSSEGEEYTRSQSVYCQLPISGTDGDEGI